MNRRSVLLSAASVLALSGCGLITSNTTNGVTVYTVDVGRLDNLVQLTVSAVGQFVYLPFVSASARAMFDAVSGTILADSAAFLKSAGGPVMLKLDTATLQSQFATVVADAQIILGYVEASLPKTPLPNTAMQLVGAIKTFVLLIEALAPPVVPVASRPAGPMASVPVMSEPQATAVATH